MIRRTRAGGIASARRPGGNVAIIVALGSTLLLGAAAIGIDLGLVVQARRKAQGAADIAAMMAATDPAQADAMARRSLGDNGYGSASATVDVGTYDANQQGLHSAAALTRGPARRMPRASASRPRSRSPSAGPSGSPARSRSG